MPVYGILDSFLFQSLHHTFLFANMIAYKTCKANDFNKL